MVEKHTRRNRLCPLCKGDNVYTMGYRDIDDKNKQKKPAGYVYYCPECRAVICGDRTLELVHLVYTLPQQGADVK